MPRDLERSGSAPTPTAQDRDLDRASVEQALREANERLRATLDSITDGVLVLDREWRYTYVSERAGKIIGLAPATLLGGCVWELFPHARGTKFDREYHRAVETGQPVHFEEYYPAPLEQWLECHCYPSPAGLTVYFRDVTAQRYGEEALRASERLATARASELQTVLDTVPAAVWIARDPQGDRIDANRFGAELLRRPAGSNVSITASEDQRPQNFRVMRRGAELTADELPIQAAARSGLRDCELDLAFDDGTVLHLLGNASPLLDEQGRPR